MVWPFDFVIVVKKYDTSGSIFSILTNFLNLFQSVRVEKKWKAIEFYGFLVARLNINTYYQHPTWLFTYLYFF